MSAPARKPKGSRRGGTPSLVRKVAIALGVVAALWLLRVPLLRGVGALLVVEDPLERADYLFLLGGDIHNRPDLAAALYHRGLAPRLALARVRDSPAVAAGFYPNETDATVGYLHDLGVPDSAIVVVRRPGGVSSTDDEAVAFRALVEREGARSVLLVTSDYHTRRARWLFRRALAGLDVDVRTAGAPTSTIDPDAWWRSEDGAVLYLQEYVKLLHNLVVRR